MAQPQAQFELTERHLATGLISEAELSAYAGIPVVVRAITDYPYGQDLMDHALEETTEKFRERCAAVYEDLKDLRALPPLSYEAFLQVAPNGNLKMQKAQSELKTLATTLNCALWNEYDCAFLAPEKFIADGPAGAVDGVSLCKDPFAERKAALVRVEEGTRLYAAARKSLMIVWPEEAYTKKWAAHVLHVEESQIAVEPSCAKALGLYVQLHEMRHALQVSAESGGDPYRYVEELDADAFAFSAMKKVGYGAEALALAMNIRWICLLIGADKFYGIAPALESVLAGQKPVCLPAVNRSLARVKRELTSQMLGDVAEASVPLSGVQDERIRSMYFKNPAGVFTPLAACVQEKVFADDPLAQHLATSVTRAAAAINPAWLRVPEMPCAKSLSWGRFLLPKVGS